MTSTQVLTGTDHFLGIDIGSLATKGVLLDAEDRLVGSLVIDTGSRPRESGRNIFDQLLSSSGLNGDTLGAAVVTGYGRVSSEFASKMFTEIACHARGAYHQNNNIRTVIDIGGQDSKVIKLDDLGNVVDFCMNDKCAAGTGKFLEIISGTLSVELTEIGAVVAGSHSPCSLSSTCSVFAESEVISLLAEGASREDILAGVCRAVARRVGNMAGRLRVDKEVVFVGGVSKNQAVRLALQEFLGIEFSELEMDPQLNGALGAALLGRGAVRNGN